LLTDSYLCTSRWPVHVWLWGTYEFCRWINMPIGQ
jgi:hypothetical protein